MTSRGRLLKEVPQALQTIKSCVARYDGLGLSFQPQGGQLDHVNAHVIIYMPTM